uniref:Uncharacterized protein n=1 Tax=Tanacetum cinerariifolium TaxID=118510 RepID=A0A699H4Y6_TANCI|nr:hypothetical protein [Tanacetum cinerariifolium]
MNKLVKGNLVKGLPSKIFQNDNSCVACQKGKQHKASYKAKLVNTISKPLHMLHMDLFGPTNVKILMKNSYCLVVTDDFSRFSWFCEDKCIKREFSVARTPQQNRVTERRNRTLIEVARTMALVTKPHNKTPYELIRGRSPLIDFMKPFGCPVTILNTRDNLGKFKGKADEGYFIGYSVVSKAMRVFNKRTRIVEETLNIRFQENAPNVKGNGPDWLFDIDSLTISLNYVPVVARNQTNGSKDSTMDAGKKAPEVDESKASDNVGKNDQVSRSEVESLPQQARQTEKINSPNSFNTVSSPVNTVGSSFVNAASQTPINAAGPSASTNAFEEHYFEQLSPFKNAFSLPHVPIMTLIDDTGIFGNAYDDEVLKEEVDMNNVDSSYTIPEATKFFKDHPQEQVNGSLETPVQTRQMSKTHKEFGLLSSVYRNKKDERGILIKNKARLVAQGHTQEEGIDYDEVFAPVARIEAIRLFLAYASFQDFVVYQMDVKSAFRYERIEEEVDVCQHHGFEDLNFPDKVYKMEKALYGLHQAPRAMYETFSTYLLDNSFHRGQIDKTLFIKRHKDDILLVQVYVDDIIFGSTKKELTSTPIESNKALIKDKEGEDVDVHLYRSMIGSLMYLTTSRPDITFVVCACARFQVNPKTSHLQAVKRIFKYLKGQPKLGLWHPKDSPFDLEAYSDSDYAGASLDRKATTEGCQFLGKRQVLWIQNQMLDYGFNLMNTKIYIDNESTICIVKNPVFHSKTKHIKIRNYFIRDSYEKKLIQVIKIHTDKNIADLLTKDFDVSSTMASAITCLADNQKFNFSKYIFDNMVKSLEAGVKFYLFSIFLQVFLDKKVEGMARHKEMYVISSHTKKIFANVRRIGAGFSGPRRTQRKEVEISHDESEDDDHVPTPFSDPLPSVTKLTKWRKSRYGGLRRLKKIGLCRRVKSPMEKDGLGAQEDASKQGRVIEEIDQITGIALDNETQGRKNDDEMFGVDDLAGEEVVMDSVVKPVTTVKDSAAPTTDVIKDEITMAQALAALKSVKLKVVVQEQEMSTTISAAATRVTTIVLTPRAKVPLQKKDQMRIDEEYARKLQANKQEATRLSKAQQDEEANNSWDNIQAMMDANRLLTERLQEREREAFSEVQKARLEMRKVNDFVAMDSEAQKSNENVKPIIDDTEELKKCMEIVPDNGDEVLIKATPISSRSPTIIHYKIHKEGKKNYFKIIRVDGNSQVYQTFERMFKNFNRDDLEVMWAIVKDRFKKEKPVDDMDNILFRTLKTMFERHVEDTIWKYQQGLAKVKNWKLFESCGVYCITMQSAIYYLLVEKVYPLIRNTLHQLWSDVRLQVDYDIEMAYDLLRFIIK